MSGKNNIFSEFIEKYKHDPVRFVREILLEEPDPWQIELLEATLTERLCAVKSGHGIGKSTCCAWLMLHHMLCFYPQKTVCTAPTASQLFDALTRYCTGAILDGCATTQLPPSTSVSISWMPAPNNSTRPPSLLLSYLLLP